MNFSVSLEDETRGVVETLSSQLVLESAIYLSTSKLLRYLDPYGDTIFNRYQIDDLIVDLEKLAELITDIRIS
jgi:hypothetical protein